MRGRPRDTGRGQEFSGLPDPSNRLALLAGGQRDPGDPPVLVIYRGSELRPSSNLSRTMDDFFSPRATLDQQAEVA